MHLDLLQNLCSDSWFLSCTTLLLLPLCRGLLLSFNNCSWCFWRISPVRYFHFYSFLVLQHIFCPFHPSFNCKCNACSITKSLIWNYIMISGTKQIAMETHLKYLFSKTMKFKISLKQKFSFCFSPPIKDHNHRMLLQV